MNTTIHKRMPRRPLRWALVPTGAFAVMLSVAAVAWACTAAIHSMSVNPKQGVGSTAVIVTGTCVASPSGGHAGCSDSGDRGIYATLGFGVKAIDDHQDLCTRSSTQLPGSTTAPAPTFNGNTTMNQPPGEYIICAGINPELLWDTFTML